MAKLDKETLRNMIHSGREGLYLTKDDLYNAGSKLELYVTRAMNWDAMFDHLYDNADYFKLIEFLVAEANLRLKECQEYAKEGYEWANEAISKLNTFVDVLQGKQAVTQIRATTERVVETRERETVEVLRPSRVEKWSVHVPYAGNEHNLLKLIAAGIIAEKWGDSLVGEILIEKKVIGMPGEPPLDVYAEVGQNVPIIAEVKRYAAMTEVKRFLYDCNKLKPYVAYFLALDLGEPERFTIKHEGFAIRRKDGKESGQAYAELIEAKAISVWFDKIKHRIRYESPNLYLDY